ncbi:intraflagellar transport protein 74 homolog [Hyalella azteca]|uniref:Intraflagellar transport protein 74 homolog n=1 Tax=Hyalella azteca TaxID=294128 RepID=A0A8B7PG31_HYAAZ|nr:intraflagellar transport protein 74 homolog [Hyalella azteca]
MLSGEEEIDASSEAEAPEEEAISRPTSVLSEAEAEPGSSRPQTNQSNRVSIDDNIKGFEDYTQTNRSNRFSGSGKLYDVDENHSGPEENGSGGQENQAKTDYPPPSRSGYPPPSGSGYPPPSGSGYPPPSRSGYPPPSRSGYPPPSRSGYPPPSRAGYPLDRERSAGRESLVSRGQGGAMDRLPTRSGRMSAVSGMRPLTSAGRMSRAGDPDHSGPMVGVHPDRRDSATPLTRPTTSGRLLTSRPVSAALKNAPSTATRLLHAASAVRPGTRGGLTTTRGLNTPINVVDRPITQQGLTGMKTGARAPARQVQDKSYFMGVLRTKMADLASEMTKMAAKITAMQHEQSSFLTYDKRVKEMAQELTELQGTLADYNLLVDLTNTDTEKIEIDEECQELTMLNQEESAKLEAIFEEKKELEAAVRGMEAQLEDERHMGESIIEGMQPALKGRYTQLQNNNRNLQQQMEQLQQQIDSLTARKLSLEDELAVSKVKQEAVGLSERLQEVESKKEQLLQEKQQRGTPKEERERLLLQVKDDNAEIATMERQISELQDEMGRLQNDLQSVDQEIEENQSERSQKYRELRKREETMQQFLDGFEQSRVEETQRIEQVEEAIVLLLEKLSRDLMHFGRLPNVSEFDTLKSDLAFKEGELEKSRYTVQSLGQEHLNLQANLQKIEALESKVQKELVDIKEKIQIMENEVVEFGDLQGLRARADEKRKDLAIEKDELEAKKTAVTFALQEVEDTIKMLKKQLSDNDTHKQLVSQEKKWALLEMNNFTAKEFVAQKKAESDYIPVKNQAMNIVVDYNKALQEVVASGGIIG